MVFRLSRSFGFWCTTHYLLVFFMENISLGFFNQTLLSIMKMWPFIKINRFDFEMYQKKVQILAGIGLDVFIKRYFVR